MGCDLDLGEVPGVHPYVEAHLTPHPRKLLLPLSLSHCQFSRHARVWWHEQQVFKLLAARERTLHMQSYVARRMVT